MRRASAAEAETITRTTAGVEGWLTQHEALYLLRLAAHGPQSGAIVEIGSFHGKSTVVLGQGSKRVGREKVVAIDPNKGGACEEFHQNLARAGVSDHVVPIVATSDAVARDWTEPIRLLWIDGNHNLEQVRRDFRNWTPFLVEGGIVAFHDSYQWEGVREVLEGEVMTSRDFLLIGLVDSITAFRKVASYGTRDGLRSRLMRVGRHLYWMDGGRSLPGDLRRAVKTGLRSLTSIA